MKKIILAEDDPGIQDSIQMILETEGYQVTVFPNGEDLLNKRFETPDLFILDRQLSGVDGLDICRFLKNDADSKEIPVIILSASPQIGPMAKKAGAQDFLEKPFRIDHLRKLVAKHTEKER